MVTGGRGAMGLIDGQIALITGAAGGIGTAMVEAFAAAGARVVACDRTAELLAPVAAEHKHGFDLTDPAACRTALEAVTETVGLPDIVISNAGATRADTLEDLDDAAWADELAGNLTAARNLTAPLLPGMRRRGHGSLVFVSSVNALAHFGNPAYAAAKAGLVAYARAIAAECGRAGLRSNTICPGTVRTPIWRRRIADNPAILERLSRLYPLGRIVEPAEVAQVALFLASPMASAVTGVTLPIDAGLMAGNLPFIHEIA